MIRFRYQVVKIRRQSSLILKNVLSLLKYLLNFNPLSANPTKWSNTLKQFVGNLPTNCLSVFDHFRNLALKGSKIEDPIIIILAILIQDP